MRFHQVRDDGAVALGSEIHPARRWRWLRPGGPKALLAAVLLFGTATSVGCTSITTLSIPQETVVGPPYVITLQVRPESDQGNVRGVFAFRYPSRWNVLSVTYAGSYIGSAHRSQNMVDYFQNDWESQPEDDRHNGHVPNSEWWAGYSDVHDWKAVDNIIITITMNTDRVTGNSVVDGKIVALLDFVTGVTSADNPGNLGNQPYWETGAVRLNETALLYSFSDVNENTPYHFAIENLAHGRIIGGYIDPATQIAEFRPRRPVLRAQFAKMMVGAMGLVAREDSVSPFTDLGPDDPNSLYPHEFVARIAEEGVTLGKTATTFAPWEDISRAQVVTMVVRAAQGGDTVLQEPPEDYQGTWGGFHPAHGENARMAEWNDLLLGLPLAGAASDPWAPMPRGEVAQVLSNLISGPLLD